MKYLLLLRGINVGGHSRVAMQELKLALTNVGFNRVTSYINSGNLIFESTLSQQKISDKIEQLLKNNYKFPIVSMVISEVEYRSDFVNLPKWWGEDEQLRHNALFLLPTFDKNGFDDIRNRITEYDQVEFREHVILWTSTLKKDFSKSLYSKLMKEKFYHDISIRNRNTALKLLALLSEKSGEQ